MSENEINKKPNEPLGQSSIHTLESDLASAVMDNNYGKNIIKIVTDPSKNSTFETNFSAEEKKISKTNFFNKRNIFIFFIVIFVLISISVISYILFQAQNIEKNKDIPNENISTSTLDTAGLPVERPIINNSDILNSEIIQSSDFTKLNRVDMLLEIGKIKQILFDKNISANNTITINTNITVNQLFEKIQYSGDESLLRSFGDIFAFGLYTNESKQFENYLLIEIDNFDLAFQSILGWEKYMPVDLKDIFIGNNEIVQSNSTTTPIEKQYRKPDTKTFTDRVLKNYDVREYVKNETNTDIIYGFINKKFLLITSGESSFLDIKNRLLKENIQR